MDETEVSQMKDIKHLMKHETKDFLLVRLIDLANSGYCAPITLNVGGTLVTGILTPGSQYYKEFGDDLVAGLPDNISNPLLDEFKRYAEEYAEGPDDLSENPYRYIHLKNANVVTTSGFVPSDGNVLWRGKVSSVDAFWFGSLGGSKKPQAN